MSDDEDIQLSEIPEGYDPDAAARLTVLGHNVSVTSASDYLSSIARADGAKDPILCVLHNLKKLNMWTWGMWVQQQNKAIQATAQKVRPNRLYERSTDGKIGYVVGYAQDGRVSFQIAGSTLYSLWPVESLRDVTDALRRRYGLDRT